MMRKTFNISLEGNVGGGKSTVLSLFEQHSNFTIVPEPVSKWVDLNGLNLIERTYTNPEDNYFAFQMYVFLTQLEDFHSRKGKIRIFERSPYSSFRVFVREREDKLKAVEREVCQEWFKFLSRNKQVGIKLDLIIYVRTDPTVALERIRSRNRAGEESITLETVQRFHELHEQWLRNETEIPVWVIDGNQGLDRIERLVKKISSFLKASPRDPSNEGQALFHSGTAPLGDEGQDDQGHYGHHRQD